MWDNWKSRENHGYGCPKLLVGDQKLLMATNECPMEGIIGHGLGMDWAIEAPARECLLRDMDVRRTGDGQLGGARDGNFPRNVWSYTRRGEWARDGGNRQIPANGPNRPVVRRTVIWLPP